MPTQTESAELARLRSFTIWEILQQAAAIDPEHCALVGASDAGDVKRLTYHQLLTHIRDLSAGLASIGVRRGDRVILWMTNTFEWVVSAFATMRIGASVVPVNTFLKAPEIKYFIQQSGARHLLMMDGFRTLKMLELLAEICPEVALNKTPGFLFSEALPDLRYIVLYRRSSGQLDCAYDFDELAGGATAQAHALADQMERATQASDLAMVKYTSGSTAFPKGVMLEQGGIVANAVLHSRRMGVGRSDVYFSMMPFFHAGGSIYGLMTMLVHGGTLVFTETFNAALAADLIVAEQGTVFVTMLGDEVVQAALSSYRPGEAASICNGSLLEGNEGRIVDPETGKDVSTGTPGELLLRGNIARGYWNKPVETARAFTQDGWFRTEDLVSMNADGYLTWHGRVKLMLKVGGENVSIEEVERVVTSHDTVAECGAVGMPDKRKGEAIRLYVRASPGQALNEEDLRAWLKPRVAHFKLPREIVFVDSLPHLGSGKIDRVQLAQWAKALSQP